MAYYLLPVVILLSICLGANCNGISKNDSSISIEEGTVRPEVIIPQGTVRGLNMVTHHGRNIFGFLGIPFAQPPVGNLRFRAPLPASAWKGIFDARNGTNMCPQISFYSTVIEGDEDCLYINVYTPRLPTNNDSTLLPVMMYIHGGAFKHGSNSYEQFGPQFLLDKEVILVVPNYRLGLLGFFTTGDEASPGNYGLKDLVRALEWNRDNIRYFGGDPNQVTIFGESAGAMSIHLMTLSNLTNGLFHKYITESGSALSFQVQTPRIVYENLSTRMGKNFGCSTNTSIALVDCLRNLNVSQLFNSNSLFQVWGDNPVIIWGPTIEPNIEGAFLTDTPKNLFDAGKIRDLPWICTVNRDEGLLFTASFYKNLDKFEEVLDHIDVFLPLVLSYDSLVNNVTAYTSALKSYYLNDLSANRTLLLKNLTQLIGDGIFAYSTYSGAEKNLILAKNPQYFGSFEYRGTFSHSYLFSGGSTENHGVSHADEIIYHVQRSHFGLGNPGDEMNDADWKMVETIIQLWTSFAISGTPTYTLDSGTVGIWEPYSARKNYLRIGNGSDTSVGVEYDYLKDRMRFWEELTVATSWK